MQRAVHVPVPILVFLSIFLLWKPCAGQEAFRLSNSVSFSFGMDWGNIWPVGDMLIPAGGRPDSGMKLDIGTDLGITQGETVSFFLRSAVLDAHLFALEYTAFSPTGAIQAPRAFRFHNRTYRKGTLLDTKLDYNWSRFGYAYRFELPIDAWVAPSLAVHYIRNTATINGDTEEEGIVSNTRSLDGVYPTLGVTAGFLLPYGFAATTELEGVHLITRGYLGMARLGVTRRVHPEILFSANALFKTIHYVETNQALNNEWNYSFFGLSTGIAFSF